MLTDLSTEPFLSNLWLAKTLFLEVFITEFLSHDDRLLGLQGPHGLYKRKIFDFTTYHIGLCADFTPTRERWTRKLQTAPLAPGKSTSL
jgi:hypothetical protein